LPKYPYDRKTMALTINTSNLYNQVEVMSATIVDRIADGFRPLAQKVEKEMKDGVGAKRNPVWRRSPGLGVYQLIGYPWSDRTGNARRRLRVDVIRQGNRVIIRHSHNVWYGKYLEFAMEKRFAILYPTLRRKRNQYLALENKIAKTVVKNGG